MFIEHPKVRHGGFIWQTSEWTKTPGFVNKQVVCASSGQCASPFLRFVRGEGVFFKVRHRRV